VSYFASSNNSKPCLWLGIGFRQGLSQELLAQEIDRVCQKYRIIKGEILGVASIDLKAADPVPINYCKANNFLWRTFSAAQLQNIKIPHPATIVGDKIGTFSVAEAAAILAASTQLRTANLIVPKQILPEGAEKATITLAIAR
jgi:cobalamin biosynthesis protein CbiG